MSRTQRRQRLSPLTQPQLQARWKQRAHHNQESALSSRSSASARSRTMRFCPSLAPPAPSDWQCSRHPLPRGNCSTAEPSFQPPVAFSTTVACAGLVASFVNGGRRPIRAEPHPRHAPPRLPQNERSRRTRLFGQVARDPLARIRRWLPQRSSRPDSSVQRSSSVAEGRAASSDQRGQKLSPDRVFIQKTAGAGARFCFSAAMRSRCRSIQDSLVSLGSQVLAANRSG